MATTTQPPPQLLRGISKEISKSTHGKAIKEFACKVPDIYRDNYSKAMSGKSRAAAVKAKCLDCCCWQRKEVQLCTTVTYPLWMYRPYQKLSDQSSNDKKTTSESPLCCES